MDDFFQIFQNELSLFYNNRIKFKTNWEREGERERINQILEVYNKLTKWNVLLGW